MVVVIVAVGRRCVPTASKLVLLLSKPVSYSSSDLASTHSRHCSFLRKLLSARSEVCDLLATDELSGSQTGTWFVGLCCVRRPLNRTTSIVEQSGRVLCGFPATCLPLVSLTCQRRCTTVASNLAQARRDQTPQFVSLSGANGKADD